MNGLNVFDLVGLREDASSFEIREKIKEIKKRSSRYKDKDLFDRIIRALEIYEGRALDRERFEELAKEAPKRSHLSKETEDALEYFSTEKEAEPKKKKKKSYKLQKALITIGVLAIIFSAGTRISDNVRARDCQNNVCIEYRIQKGDTYNWVDENFRDYTVIHTQFVGPNYNFDYLYEDDIIVGRTTLEIAKELEAKGYARIITIDEAIEIMEVSGSHMVGRFKEYKENSNTENQSFVFFDPDIKLVI